MKPSPTPCYPSATKVQRAMTWPSIFERQMRWRPNLDAWLEEARGRCGRFLHGPLGDIARAKGMKQQVAKRHGPSAGRAFIRALSAMASKLRHRAER